VLNIFGEQQREMLDSEIQSLIDQRQEARHRRDFGRADEIREDLGNRGIILEDTKDGVRWKRK
jgi:cysteinyl-tRNA synthetase